MLCPMQDGPPIPWALAEAIYKELYVACFGNIQSLQSIVDRGGFGYCEIYDMSKRLDRKRKGGAEWQVDTGE